MRFLNRFLFAAVLTAASAPSGFAQSASPVGGGIRMQGGGPLGGGGGISNFGGGPLGRPGGGIGNVGGGPLRAYGGSFQPGGNRTTPLPGAIPGYAVTTTPGGLVQAPNPFVGFPADIPSVAGEAVPNPASQFGPAFAPSQIGAATGPGFLTPGGVGRAVGTINYPVGVTQPVGGMAWMGGVGSAPVFSTPAFPGNVPVGGVGGPVSAGFTVSAPVGRVPGATVATLAPPRP